MNLSFNQWIYFSILILILICAFTGIGMTFYLGRKKVKEIDQLVYGRKRRSDSIFHLILRLPSYGAAFASPWIAKRSHLTHIRDHFDKTFQRPFIITYYLFMVGVISMALLFILDILYLKVGTY